MLPTTTDDQPCRHNGGTTDCPPICLLLHGDRFTTIPLTEDSTHAPT